MRSADAVHFYDDNSEKFYPVNWNATTFDCEIENIRLTFEKLLNMNTIINNINLEKLSF